MVWWLLRPGQAQQEPTPHGSMREAIMSSQLSPALSLPGSLQWASERALAINRKIPKKQSAVTVLNYLGRGGNEIAVKGIMTRALVCGLSALIYGLSETFRMDIDCPLPPPLLLHCSTSLLLFCGFNLSSALAKLTWAVRNWEATANRSLARLRTLIMEPVWSSHAPATGGISESSVTLSLSSPLSFVFMGDFEWHWTWI